MQAYFEMATAPSGFVTVTYYGAAGRATVGEAMTESGLDGAKDRPAEFRRAATGYYRVFVIVMALVAIGIAVLGWWIGGWWGLVGGVAVGVVVFAGGAIAGTLLWAMTQDGG